LRRYLRIYLENVKQHTEHRIRDSLGFVLLVLSDEHHLHGLSIVFRFILKCCGHTAMSPTWVERVWSNDE
jgi:hypothetical protein